MSEAEGVMFEEATVIADGRHRTFFDRAGEVRQVWARRPDGSLFYLANGAVDGEIRAEAHAGRLTCPYPGCPAPRFIARGGPKRRHHFAHQVADQRHLPAAAWRHEAMLMLADWCARRYPSLEVNLDDQQQDGWLRVRSPRSGRLLRLAVTYDRGCQLPDADSDHVLVGHSRALLLPRHEMVGASGWWWCGQGRLVSDLIDEREWALAVNPQERLIATIAPADLACEARLGTERPRGPLLCVVDELDHARLEADGIHTLASDALAQALQRRRDRESALERYVREAEAQARARHHARGAEAEHRRTEARVHRHQSVPSFARQPANGPMNRALETEERPWPCNLQALRRLLGDSDLARRIEQPLITDVECDVPPGIWHVMTVLDLRKRGGEAHPLAIRAAIVQCGCGYSLTGEAIAGVLSVARDTR